MHPPYLTNSLKLHNTCLEGPSLCFAKQRNILTSVWIWMKYLQITFFLESSCWSLGLLTRSLFLPYVFLISCCRGRLRHIELEMKMFSSQMSWFGVAEVKILSIAKGLCSSRGVSSICLRPSEWENLIKSARVPFGFKTKSFGQLLNNSLNFWPVSSHVNADTYKPICRQSLYI